MAQRDRACCVPFELGKGRLQLLLGFESGRLVQGLATERRKEAVEDDLSGYGTNSRNRRVSECDVACLALLNQHAGVLGGTMALRMNSRASSMRAFVCGSAENKLELPFWLR